MSKKLVTSESVCSGHPDKVADQVSDAVLDAIIAKDKSARVACETFVGMGVVLIGGEITTTANINITDIVRKKIISIGYNKPEYGFDGNSVGVLLNINKQSPDIAQGVDMGKKKGTGAGDQGSVIGYACDETKELMPLPITFAHNLVKKIDLLRESKEIDYLRPDGKAQVTFLYENGKPISLENVVISVQHDEGVENSAISKDITDKVIKPVCGKYLVDKTNLFINNTGRFVVGGPVGDTGLTGRKIVVDAYGVGTAVGGGAFSGKDATKVDRSGAYMARYIAKNIVAAKLAQRCQVVISYVIGREQPTDINISTFGTAAVEESFLEAAVEKIFDVTPDGIIEQLQLLTPIYSQTATYGHFGREEFAWEKTDKIEDLLKNIY